MLYVPGDVACLGVVLKIIAAVGGNDVLSWSHDIGLDKTVECGAYAWHICPYAVNTAIAVFPLPEIVVMACYVGIGTHGDGRWRTGGCQDVVTEHGIMECGIKVVGGELAVHPQEFHPALLPYHLQGEGHFESEIPGAGDGQLIASGKSVERIGEGDDVDDVLLAAHLDGVGEVGVRALQNLLGSGFINIRWWSIGVDADLEGEGAIGANLVAYQVTVIEEKAACRLYTAGLKYVWREVTGIACGGDEYTTGPRHALEDFIKEEIAGAKHVGIALAEGDDARFPHFVGIVEDIFEAQGISCGGEAVEVFLGDKDGIFSNGIADQTEFALGSYALIGWRVAAAGCYASGMGTMRLAESVAWMSMCKNGFTGGKLGPYVGGVVAIIGEHVP